MRAETEAPPEELDGIECAVTEAGNGAHVYVPKEWRGKFVRVVKLGSYWPPLFEPIVENVNDDEGVDVYVEFDNEAFEELLEVSGRAVEYDMDEMPEKMIATVKLENFESGERTPSEYRIQAEREVGSNGWDDSEYVLEREVVDFDSVDSVMTLSGGVMWEEIGAVRGVSAKKTRDV